MSKDPKRVPLGKPPKRTDAMRQALATVTPEKLQAARELWDENCRPIARGLLDAKTKEPDEK